MSKEERIVRYTAEEIDAMIARGESKTNWARVDALTQEELEASIDVEEEGEIDWDNFRVVSNRVSIQPDLLMWFVHEGEGHEARINQVLRAYVDAQREREAKGRQAS